MSDSPFVPFYTSDFLAGTSGMTAASKGVYITLLCLLYEAETPLPQSWETLARRCGCTLPAFRRAIESLKDDGKVVITEAGIWSPKCERHIAQRRERQRSATAAAKTRWEKEKEKQGEGDAGAMRGQCEPEPEPDPEPDLKRSRAREASPDFQQKGANPSPGAIPKTEGAIPRQPGAIRAKPGADPDSTARETLLAAMGAPMGIAGPSAMLGGMADMAEARKWSDMGLSLDDQCRLISERMAHRRARQPGFTVSRFSYFTPAMADLAEARRAGVPSPGAVHRPTVDAQRARWRKIAGGS